MKKLWVVMALALLGMRAGAQAVNPQNTFGGAVSVNNPSLWVNFNDKTTSFLDQISGQSFSPLALNHPWQIPATLTGSNPAGYVIINPVALPAGTLAAIRVQYLTAPTAGQTVTVGIFNNTSGANFTPSSSFTLTVTATAAQQTITSGVPSTTITAGQYLGFWVASGSAPAYSAAVAGQYYLVASTFPSGSSAYSFSGAGGQIAMTPVISVTSPGTAIARQAGFDATNNTNYSAAFPYNAWNAAPNGSLGSYDWFTPSSMMVHVDMLNWTRSGTLVLASKGDVGSTANNYWELYLQMNGWNSQLCYTRSGSGKAIGNWGGVITQGICTSASLDAMPNGLNYSLVVTDSGTGSSGWGGTQALNMYVNGLQVGSNGIAGSWYSGTYQYGFGAVQVSVVSGGTGFTATTAFTSTGGGANCNVAGTITEAGGVMTTGTGGVTYTSDYGCTSAPTIMLTSSTGKGATFSSTLNGASVASSAPLMAPGYVSAGSSTGIAGATTTQTSTYVDEFAMFPSVLSFGAISNIFYETKFYQGIVNTATPKPVVILDDDTFVDSDNEFLLAMTIGAHKAGVITLAGVVVEDYTPAAIAAWRQMLDSAGLNDVPVTIPPVDPGSESNYPTANVLAYNASTPLTLSAWGSSTAMYRKIFAKYPTSPIKVLLGGAVWGAYAAFTSSAADSASSLTGLQLIAQNGANGGAIYAQGWLYDLTASGGTVVSNNQTMPIIWVGGTPMSGGPGALSTRTANDPLWMWFHSAGSDVRQCYDCLTLEAAVSSYFTFGVSMTATGGTGYANLTPFTLSGTGSNVNCHGSGYLMASSGVLTGVEFPWGSSAVGVASGVGSGCITTPTVTLTGSTGTGGTITATPTPCGTNLVSDGVPTNTYSIATCTNEYMTQGSFNTNQSPVSGAMMTWLINSWVDPAIPGGVGTQQ